MNESELSQKNIELAKNHPELVKLHERESKLIVTHPETVEAYKSEATLIEQIYLSAPDDEFSLRVRKQVLPTGTKYTATLKDTGEVIDGARDRIEINANDISPETYDHYASNPNFARLTQRRAQVTDEMTVDFIEGFAYPIIEIETDDPLLRKEYMQQLEGTVKDLTGDRTLDKEYLAYQVSGFEKQITPESLDHFAYRIVKEMVAHYSTGKRQVVVGLTGMSGSGKTTVTRSIQDTITELFGEDYTPLVISTDDYHFGKTHLEAIYGAPWTEWDDPRTYNTAELAEDISLMAEGNSLIRRHFDFESEEVVFDEEVSASPFIIVEGLYAGSNDLKAVRDLHFTLPTSIATAVGRDVRRLVIENRANRAFPTPESRLKYQIETALPLYLSQERPTRNGFSGCARIMAERAFMLDQLRLVES
jgi:uridine kinase